MTKRNSKDPNARGHHPDHPSPDDPQHFMGVDGAAPCVWCGRWTGLRNPEGEPRCARCQGHRHP